MYVYILTHPNAFGWMCIFDAKFSRKSGKNLKYLTNFKYEAF